MTTSACNEEQGKVVSAMASAFTAQIFAVFVAFVPPLVALAFAWTNDDYSLKWALHQLNSGEGGGRAKPLNVKLAP